MIRVCFYLCDYEEEIWSFLPSRVNHGDSFFMDSFVGEKEEKELKPETFNDLSYGEILYCSSIIWDRDEKSIYQKIYLVKEI